MKGDSRDEQLEALQAVVKNAESKLRSAEITVKDIEDKIRSEEEVFASKIGEKSAAYKSQTGADFNRVVDENGRVKYEFTRDTTSKEKKKRKKLIIRRKFNETTGKRSVKVELYTEPTDETAYINSAKDFDKPKERKKFIAFNMFGYRRFDINTECNPFLKAVGTPIVIPIQKAAELQKKVSEEIQKFGETSVGKTINSVGRGIKTSGKIISAPIVIPVKCVKDIADKGGVIHAVTDLGDRIKIEGNIPKPLQAASNAVVGVAKGTETAFVETSKGIGKFSIEIAKNKIYEEINKGISENEASQAAYVIGLKMIDVYKILNEHSKFKRAVNRDKAGNDVTDPNVSRWLADKDEKRFQSGQDKLKEQKAFAEHNVTTARAEYEAAKKRLEAYQKSKGIKISPTITESTKNTGVSFSKPQLTPTEKKIEKTKRKLKLVQKHKYSVKFKKVVDTDKSDNPKMKLKPVLMREEITTAPPANAWNTMKKLDGLAVRDTALSLRRKAMRDGGDNVGVEAANFAITTAQAGNRFIKFADDKEKQILEKHYKNKLLTLENKQCYENKYEPKTSTESTRKELKFKDNSHARKKIPKKGKELQKEQIKKKQHRKAFSVYKQKQKQAAKDILKEASKVALSHAKGVVICILIIIVVILIPVFSFTMCGGGTGTTNTVLESVISPCNTNDLGLCDRYYTELAKNMIDVHQNIDYYYQDYSKYICLTEIDTISHSPEKLLPYLAVKTIVGNGNYEWSFEEAIPYIEEVFNLQYEFVTNEKHEVRKNVTTKTYTNEDEFYSGLGQSEYALERPSEEIPNPLKSDIYAGFANTYTHVEHIVMEGYIENTLSDVGVHSVVTTNQETGEEEIQDSTEYDEAQTITFQNKWQIILVYDYQDDGTYLEYWKYTEEYQEYYEYDYLSLEYAIKENYIEVDDSYWTDTDSSWADNNFDKLIYNLVTQFTEEEQEGFQNYYTSLMGHQELELPFSEPQIAKYPGYNTDIDGDMSLDNSMYLYTYPGQEIVCGMDGTVTAIDDTSFSIYNEKYGTVYYSGATIPINTEVKKGDIISSATSELLGISFIDNDSNYLNPLFIFS